MSCGYAPETASTGDILGQEQAQAERKEQVLDALTRIAAQIRARLGESLATIREHSTPLEQATTPSLEALKAYSVARNALFARGFAAAIPHLQRAIAIDPQFAMAHADLGFFYWNMGHTDVGAEHVRKAYELRDRVSDRERLFILFLYDRQVTGNLQKELGTIESWVQTYPGDWQAWSVWGGWGTRGTGQYEKGIRAAEEAIRLNPDFPFGYECSYYPQYFAWPVRRSCGCIAAGCRPQIGNPLFSGQPLLCRVSRGRRSGDETRNRSGSRKPGDGGLDVAQPGPGFGAFRTDAKRENPLAAYDRTGATERRSREGGHLPGRGGSVRSTFRILGSGKRVSPGRHSNWERAAMWSMPRRLHSRSQATFPDRKRSPRTWQNDSRKTLRCNSSIFPRCERFSRSTIRPRWTRSSGYKRRFPTTSPCRARLSSPSSEGCIPPMCAVRRTCRQGAAGRRRRSSKRFSIIAASFLPIRSARWRTCNWAEPTLSRETWPRPGTPIRTFFTLWKDADADLPVLLQARAEYAKL